MAKCNQLTPLKG